MLSKLLTDFREVFTESSCKAYYQLHNLSSPMVRHGLVSGIVFDPLYITFSSSYFVSRDKKFFVAFIVFFI
jgi:hypothetical protein